MDKVLELQDSEVAATESVDGVICIKLSQAYIRSGSCRWIQAARIHIQQGQVLREPTAYPVTVLEASLKGDYERFDNRLPLPFSRPGHFRIQILCTNNAQLRIVGHNPAIELIGERIHA